MKFQRTDQPTVRIPNHNAKGDDKQLGGLVNTQGITNKNFHDMLEILLIFDSPYTLALAGGDIVPKTGAGLQSRNYYVDGKFKTLAYLYTALLICSREFFCQRQALHVSGVLNCHGIPRRCIHDCSL